MTSKERFARDVRVLRKVARMLDRLSKRGDERREGASGEIDPAEKYPPPEITYTQGPGKWLFEIHHVGMVVHIACYDDEHEAAIAHDDLALDLFGDMANLHYPSRLEDPTDPISRRISGLPPGV